MGFIKNIIKKLMYKKQLLNNIEKAKDIRLFYVGIGKIHCSGVSNVQIEETYRVSCPFKLPIGMKMDEALKVISYLSEKLENENNIEPASEESVLCVSNNLCKYGFEKIKGKEHGHYHAVSEYIPFMQKETIFSACNEIEGVVDLFTVDGFKMFKNTSLNRRYFDWFIEGVTHEEVEEIYSKIGFDLTAMLKFEEMITARLGNNIDSRSIQN